MVMVIGLQKAELKLIQGSGKMVKCLVMGNILNKIILSIRVIFKIL